jgi:hypothetical protein
MAKAQMNIEFEIEDIPKGILPIEFERIMLRWVYDTILEDTAPFNTKRTSIAFEDADLLFELKPKEKE